MNITRAILIHHLWWHNGCYNFNTPFVVTQWLLRNSFDCWENFDKYIAVMLVVSPALIFTFRIFFATLSLSFWTHSHFSSTASLFVSRLRNLVCQSMGALSFVSCKSHNDCLYDNKMAILTSVYFRWISLKKVFFQKMISLTFALATNSLFK